MTITLKRFKTDQEGQGRKEGMPSILSCYNRRNLFIRSRFIMRLAQALILRADYQKRIEQLKQRLLNNARVQEGDTPSEDPQALLNELRRLADDLVTLIQRINQTNAQTQFEAGQTLADALAQRDMRKIQHGIYRDLAQAATIKQDRYSKSEVKFQSSVSVTDIQHQADEFAKAYRELDARIQEANWRTDVLE